MGPFDIIAVFKYNIIKYYIYFFLQLVTASAMQAFHRLFSGKPNALTLSPELNAQIITVRVNKQHNESQSLCRSPACKAKG